MPKASVFPEPVGARPQTSRPASASGMVAAWIGNGSTMPSAASAATRSSGTPSEANGTGTGDIDLLGLIESSRSGRRADPGSRHSPRDPVPWPPIAYERRQPTSERDEYP